MKDVLKIAFDELGCIKKMHHWRILVVLLFLFGGMVDLNSQNTREVVGCDKIYYSDMDSMVNHYVTDTSEISINCKFLVDKYSYIIASQSNQRGVRDYINIIIMEKDQVDRFSAQLIFVPDSMVLNPPSQVNKNSKTLRAEYHISKLSAILEMLNDSLPLYCYFKKTDNPPSASLSLRNEVHR